MQLTHRFNGPKRRPFYGWAGVVSEWPDKAAPMVDFGKWKSDPAGGGTVTFECQPFQLCMFGANSKEMQSRDKSTYFAFAGLGIDGALVLHCLPEGTDAREVFAAGQWIPPAIDDIVDAVNRAGSLEPNGMEEDIPALMRRCADGFGMNLGYRPNEKSFQNILTSWPMLSPLHAVFLAVREKQARAIAEKRAASADRRRVRFEEVLAEMAATNDEITPIIVASRMLGIPLTMEAVISRKVKDKAKELRRDFGDHFPEVSEV